MNVHPKCSWNCQNINFEKRYSQLKEIDGRILNTIEVIVPNFWSQVSVDILAQKYARQAGVPIYLKKVEEDGVPQWIQRSEENIEELLTNVPNGIEIKENDANASLRYTNENDARMIFGRVAGCWVYWGWKGKYFDDEEDARNFYDSVIQMMLQQEALANSPQQFNAGIHWAYGIFGSPQGHYHYDHVGKKVVRSTSAYERPQLHACFIQSLKDSLLGESGIMDLATKEATTFKFGSGSGTNFSTLRATNEPLTGGGTSSGMMSFLKLFDAVAGTLKSGGKSRRSAKMNTVDVDHPEIIEYITSKMYEESKVASMITGSKMIKKYIDLVKDAVKSTCNGNSYNVNDNKQLAKVILDAHEDGVPIEILIRTIDLLKQNVEDVKTEIFNADFNGNAYASVNMQNANNSVRVTDKFMSAVVQDGYHKLVNRTNANEFTQVRARKIWDALCLSAWSCGDPGIQMHDTIASWHTCPKSGAINASNPCSEFMFLDDTSCNLASLNLIKFQKEDGRLDTVKFIQSAKLWTKVLEISVHIAQYPSENIARNSHAFRPLGLGYANLGSFLMRAGIAYDSQEARSIAGYITAVMHGAAYETSAELASRIGTFEGYEVNKSDMMRVVKNHHNAVLGKECVQVNIQPLSLDHKHLTSHEISLVKELWDRVVQKGTKHGFRNAQVTVIAPTGTIGLLMGCNTTGIEPQFMLVTYKKLSGGGYIKQVDESVPHALRRLGYTDEIIKKINTYIIGNGTLRGSQFDHDFFLSKGLKQNTIDNIEKHLPDVFDINSAFSVFNIGKDVYDHFGINDYTNSSDLLKAMGLSKKNIETLNQYVCGHMCIEDCPLVKREHLNVFDCAVPNGKYGKRSISTRGHVLMVASVQPFISGAISKTFNQRHDVKVMSKNYNIDTDDTTESISDVFMLCHRYGVKCTTVFRDGSKMSAPLGSFTENDIISLIKNPTPRHKNKNSLDRGESEPMPDKRFGYTQKATIGGSHTIYYNTGENNKGELREIFITGTGNEGSTFRSIMNCFAKSVSIGLQHGTPIEKYVSAFVGASFSPSGFVKHDNHIKKTSSIIDYIFRSISANYINKTSTKSSDTDVDTDSIKSSDIHKRHQNSDKDKSDHLREMAIQQGYTGDFCPACGGLRMVLDGTCSKCMDCGTSNGC